VTYHPKAPEGYITGKEAGDIIVEEAGLPDDRELPRSLFSCQATDPAHRQRAFRQEKEVLLQGSSRSRSLPDGH